MNELSSRAGYQRQTDEDQLKMLGIFHFIGAGLALIGLLLTLVLYINFESFLSQVAQLERQLPQLEDAFVDLRWVYLTMAIWSIALSFLNLLSGLLIRAKKHRTFSLVVAAINCLQIPLGTVLGAFTILVLIRGSVRMLYGDEPEPDVGLSVGVNPLA